MAGYTKLFNSILASTIWRSSDKTRIVWITLLAMSDKNGIAEASIPGLADMARVSLQDCEAALQELQSPDPYSRTKDHEGSRISPVDGGWQILNHAKYRAKMGADERREYLRLKQREYRSRDKSTNVNNVSDIDTVLTHTEAKADTYTEATPNTTPSKIKPSRASRSDYSDDFEQFWSVYPKRAGKSAAMKAWAKASPDIIVVLSALGWQVHQPQWTKDGGQFIPNASTWINNRRWEDEVFHPPQDLTPDRRDSVGVHNAKVVMQLRESRRVTEQDDPEGFLKALKASVIK